MAAKVRLRVFPSDPQAPSGTRRQAALRRDLSSASQASSIGSEERWISTEPCSTSRSRAAVMQSRQTAVAQAAQEARHRTARDDHRQTGELCRCKARSHARRRASAAQGLKQSSGKQPSADPTTGADHEALQVSRSGPTLSLGSRSSSKPLPPLYPLQGR